MKINWALVCAWGLAGCLLATAACAPQAGADNTPSASIIFNGWGGRSQVYEYRLPDGTVCVSAQYSYKTDAISCDFSKRRE